MTNIGVAFVNAQEVIRSNRAQEALKHEANVIEAVKAQETIRHNVATEDISMREVNVKERSQALSERRYFEIEIPKAYSEIAVNSSMVQLNQARTTEAYASANLKNAQVSTEVAKQKQLNAQATLYTAQTAKAQAETRTTKLENNYLAATLSNRITYTNYTQNTFTGIRDAALPVIDTGIKYMKTVGEIVTGIAKVAMMAGG